MSTSARLIPGLAMSLIAPARIQVHRHRQSSSPSCSRPKVAGAVRRQTLLRQLADAQPFAGAYPIALEEHVDYRDRLGWRDPFSSPQFASRQADYNDQVFRSNAIYTPHLVFDGVRECVGSDRSTIRAIVADSIRRPRAAVAVQSVALLAILLVAAITVHVPYGFSSIKLREVTSAGPQFGPPGYETDLLYIAAPATLVMGGSGPLALDRLRPQSSGRLSNGDEEAR